MEWGIAKELAATFKEMGREVPERLREPACLLLAGIAQRERRGFGLPSISSNPISLPLWIQGNAVYIWPFLLQFLVIR